MSTDRRAKTPFSGKGICRWCGEQVPKGRRSWCGDACVQAYILRSDPAAMRRHVLERDRGVCAGCGFDCLMAERFLAKVRRVQKTRRPGIGAWFAAAMRECGFDVTNSPWGGDRSLWDADHILPVVEGGGGCGPENIRTLCQPCHKSETAALARRRAEARRPQLRFGLEAVS